MQNNDLKIKLLGKNIAKYRKEKHMTQEKLAKLVNVGRVHISNIENAKKSLSIDLFLKICQILDIPESKFFKF